MPDRRMVPVCGRVVQAVAASIGLAQRMGGSEADLRTKEMRCRQIRQGCIISLVPRALFSGRQRSRPELIRVINTIRGD